MKLYLAFIIFSLSICTNAKELAFTFDDSPRVANGYLTGPERATKLIQSLKKSGIARAAFFSNSFRLDDEGRERLHSYSNAGHIIANHTDAHEDLNKVGLEYFTRSFLRADEQLKVFKNYKKWFRFPYLREGDNLKRRDGMRNTLKTHGYRNAYITLNNFDWYMEHLFQKAFTEGKHIDFNLMSQFYVTTIMESIEYYDQLAVKHLKRSPKHVLLLHETDITALFIGDLARALRNKQWNFITPEDAYSDEIANYRTASIYSYTPGRIGEIAADKGQGDKIWHHTLNEAFIEKRFDLQVLQPSEIKLAPGGK